LLPIAPATPAALPTLILFKEGQPVDRIEGVVAAQDLRNRLQYFCR
jgi:protein disulfide-isomerase